MVTTVRHGLWSATRCTKAMPLSQSHVGFRFVGWLLPTFTFENWPFVWSRSLSLAISQFWSFLQNNSRCWCHWTVFCILPFFIVVVVDIFVVVALHFYGFYFMDNFFIWDHSTNANAASIFKRVYWQNVSKTQSTQMNSISILRTDTLTRPTPAIQPNQAGRKGWNKFTQRVKANKQPVEPAELYTLRWCCWSKQRLAALTKAWRSIFN